MPPTTSGRVVVPTSFTRSSRRPPKFLPKPLDLRGQKQCSGFRTAREIANSTPASIPWRAKPYLIDGAVLEIDGKIKAAGKTTFVTFMCRAILDGADFLGEPTVQGGVIYLTEQPDTSQRETLGRADLLDRDDFVVLAWTDSSAFGWPDVVDRVADEAERRGAKVLVVDTLSRFAGIHGDGENQSGEADAASAPLIRAAARGLAVISIRHERKAGGDVADAGRGSSAFGGAVDTVITIRRGEGKSASTVRSIAALSRFDDVPDTLVVELTGDRRLEAIEWTPAARPFFEKRQRECPQGALETRPLSNDDPLAWYVA